MSAASDVAMADAKFEFGRVIGQTSAIIGRNLLLFGLLALFFVGIPNFVMLYLQAQAINSGDMGELGVVSAISIIVTVISSYILIGCLTRASMDDLTGAGVKFGAAFADGFRYFLPLLLLVFLMTLGLMLGFILLFVPGVILALRWAVAAPVMIIEKRGPTGAMGRSAELSKGNRWAIFGLFAIYVLFVYAMQILVAWSLGTFRGDAVANPLLTADALGYGFALITVLVTIITSLISTVGTSALYFELRRVKEGVGVNELASVFD